MLCLKAKSKVHIENLLVSAVLTLSYLKVETDDDNSIRKLVVRIYILNLVLTYERFIGLDGNKVLLDMVEQLNNLIYSQAMLPIRLRH